MLYEKSNAGLLKDYNKRVYGHEQAKKALITLVNRSKMRHYQKYILNEPESDLIEPSKLLLIGDSGTGKTFLVEQLSEMLNFPLLILDATQLTPSGNSDGVNVKKFRELASETVKNWVDKQAKKGYTNSLEGAKDQLVIFIDEIDKLATSFDASGNWNKHVQSNFLTLFDNHGDGSGVSFIFGGAFSGLEPKAKSNIGFTKELKESVTTVLDAELVKYGLIPELIGRLTAIVKLDKFDEEDYRHVLSSVLIPKKQRHLSFFNDCSLQLSEEQTKEIVASAIQSGQGIRYLKRQLDNLSLDVEFNYEEENVNASV